MVMALSDSFPVLKQIIQPVQIQIFIMTAQYSSQNLSWYLHSAGLLVTNLSLALKIALYYCYCSLEYPPIMLIKGSIKGWCVCMCVSGAGVVEYPQLVVVGLSGKKVQGHFFSPSPSLAFRHNIQEQIYIWTHFLSLLS